MYGSFSFNGKSSEAFGVLIARFKSGGLENVSAGSQTDFKTDSVYDASKWYVISNKYKEPLEFTLELIKNTCCNNENQKYFTRDEVRAILSWLCSPYDYEEFNLDNEFFYGMNFKAKFINPQYKVIGDRISGLEVVIKFDRPFALSDDIKYQKTFYGNGTMTLFNNSDEFNKCLYPQQIIITSLSDGNIILHNNNESSHISTEFTNCVTNEIITMNCEDRFITSTNTSTHILERFNKNWIRLSYGKNIFNVNGNCKIEFKYNEVRRVGVW